MPPIKTRALVLREQPFQDADKIITLFTENEGKIKAIAKGVRRSRSTLTAATQLFAYSEIVYYPGKNFANLTQTDLIESYYDLRQDLVRMTLASYLMELLDVLFEFYQGSKAVLKMTVHLLYYMSEGLARNNEALAAAFQLKLAAVHGIMPNLNSCNRCGKGEGQYFSIEDGGLVCADCGKQTGYTYRLDAETLALMQVLYQKPIKELKNLDADQERVRRIMDMMDHYLGYNVGKPMRTYKMYKELRLP